MPVDNTLVEEAGSALLNIRRDLKEAEKRGKDAEKNYLVYSARITVCETQIKALSKIIRDNEPISFDEPRETAFTPNKKVNKV